MLTYGGGSIKKIGLFDKVVNVLKTAGIEVLCDDFLKGAKDAQQAYDAGKNV